MSKEYYGESAAQRSIEWLNENSNPATRISESRGEVARRIADILSAFQILAPLTRGKGLVDMTALESLRKSLGEFKLCPGAALRDGQLQLTFDDEADQDVFWDGGGFGIVLDLYRLAQMGVIDRVLQCQTCKKWFFGKNAQHTCCSDECRTAYEKTPERKRLRNERLQRNRRIVKEQDSRIKKAIGYSKPKARTKRRSSK